MNKTELRNIIMAYSSLPINDDDREEIEVIKEEIRSEEGKDKIDDLVEQSFISAYSHLTDITISRNNQDFYDQLLEIENNE